MSEKYFITTPIFYPNGAPHIGHAYNAIATDAMARFQRADGHDVFFLSGTDEHGLKMQQTAAKEGISPQQLSDRNSAVFKKMLAVLNCSNDDFIRTTEQRHHKSCQKLWEMMDNNGDIYLDRYAGWYSVRQEAYYDEADTFIDDNGIRRENEVRSPVEWNEEESYFFRLSNYAQPLLDLYDQQPDFIGPTERRNEIVSFVKSGLRDISISRTNFNWGIPVPGNSKHVMYVWVDALANYITACGFPETSAEKWRFWPADAHIIGKDIIRFHAIYWPAFLMSAKLPLPKRIFAHGFLLNRGEKMSKSVGNVIDPFQIVEEYGLDQVRYFLLREVPFGQDGIYSREAIINRTNADLANDLGNLAQRSLSMINKNFGGRIPAPSELVTQDLKILDQCCIALQTARKNMLEQAPHNALAAIFSVVSEANRYFASEEPWALRKTNPQRFATVLYTTAELLRRVGILIAPFMPHSAEKLLDFLAIPQNERQLSHITDSEVIINQLLPDPQPIFPKFVGGEGKV